MQSGYIHRTAVTHRFTTVENEIPQSTSLTLAEKGLLVYFLSLPVDWKIQKENLHVQLNEKKGTVDTAFRGLRSKGYIVSEKVISTDTGRFTGWSHTVFDKPQTPSPTSKKTDVGENQNRAKNGNSPISTFTDVGENRDIQIKELKGLQETEVVSLGESENFLIPSEKKNHTVEANGTEKYPPQTPPPPASEKKVLSNYDHFRSWADSMGLASIWKMASPLTKEEFARLWVDYNLDVQSNRDEFKAIVLQMENRKTLLKDYKSTNLTLRNWMNRRAAENTSLFRPKIKNTNPDR